jgi:hypothetical protein
MATREEYVNAILIALPASARTEANRKFLLAWMQKEGGSAANNPLNTTLKTDGVDSTYNSAGVRNYKDLTAGIQATLSTLRSPRYAPIYNALVAGDGAIALNGSNDAMFGAYVAGPNDPNYVSKGKEYADSIKKILSGGKLNGKAQVNSTPNHVYKGGSADGVSNDVIRSLKVTGEGESTTVQGISSGGVTGGDMDKTIPKCIITEGLDNTPWFDEVRNGTTVVGNKHLIDRTPIWFEVDTGPGGLLEGSNTQGPPRPVQLRLNCSLSNLDLQMRHKYTRTPTRTGMHITFWGMEPDTIHASGSTGAWMNQYGLTAFMSTLKSKAPKAMNDFVKSSSPGEAERKSLLTGKTMGKNAEPYKVSAQDAFAEFIALFKYNAITRYKLGNYDGYFSDRDQLGNNLWSEKYGSSTFVAGARNNDVMYRGIVRMGSRDDVYTGFFKSLNFNEDAEKPYRWNFDFVFQVQSKQRIVSSPKP